MTSCTSFGSLRVQNEDCVDAHRGFDTHPHRDAEIFYIFSGELTHGDSMISKSGSDSEQGDGFDRMKKGTYTLLLAAQESHTRSKTKATNRLTF